MSVSKYSAEFIRAFPTSRAMSEGGIEYIFVPGLEVTMSNLEEPQTVDALLCPVAHPSGYMTRLFFSEPFCGAGKSANWTSHRILDRQWHSWSWQNVPSSESALQILAAHLRALQ